MPEGFRSDRLETASASSQRGGAVAAAADVAAD